MGFSDDLAAQTAAERETEDVDLLLNGNLYMLRVTQMDGIAWASETDKFPARPGVLVDQRYGYNLRPLTKHVAPKCSVLFDADGNEVELRVDPPEVKKGRVNEWADLFSAIDGATFQRISDALFGLNEVYPAQAVDAAKKARTASAMASSN